MHESAQMNHMYTAMLSNALSNIVCIVIYPLVFYKWSKVKHNQQNNLASTANKENSNASSKSEFSCIVIGLAIFIANTVVSLYEMVKKAATIESFFKEPFA